MNTQVGCSWKIQTFYCITGAKVFPLLRSFSQMSVFSDLTSFMSDLFREESYVLDLKLITSTSLHLEGAHVHHHPRKQIVIFNFSHSIKQNG